MCKRKILRVRIGLSHKLNNINDPGKCCQGQINLAKHVNLNIIAYTRYSKPSAYNKYLRE